MWTEEELDAYEAYLESMDREFDNAVGSGLTKWTEIITYIHLILDGNYDQGYILHRFECHFKD
jgi:hypothetical protein